MSTDIRQAPGWWSNLVQAACDCGWLGPVRDLNESRGGVLVKCDRNERERTHAAEGDL